MKRDLMDEKLERSTSNVFCEPPPWQPFRAAFTLQHDVTRKEQSFMKNMNRISIETDPAYTSNNASISLKTICPQDKA